MLESPDLNWLAIGVSTLAYYILGALWFTPLFGKAWDRAIGFERKKGDRFPPIYYLVPLISCFVATVATAVLLSGLGVESVPEALQFGVVAGVGYAAAVSFTNAVTPNTPRPLLYGSVTGGYHLVGIGLAATIIVALG